MILWPLLLLEGFWLLCNCGNLPDDGLGSCCDLPWLCLGFGSLGASAVSCFRRLSAAAAAALTAAAAPAASRISPSSRISRLSCLATFVCGPAVVAVAGPLDVIWANVTGGCTLELACCAPRLSLRLALLGVSCLSPLLACARFLDLRLAWRSSRSCSQC